MLSRAEPGQRIPGGSWRERCVRVAARRGAQGSKAPSCGESWRLAAPSCMIVTIPGCARCCRVVRFVSVGWIDQPSGECRLMSIRVRVVDKGTA